MIQIKRSREEFEYELRGLCMAFFPGETITTKDEFETEDKDILTIDACFETERIGISFVKNGIPILMKEEKANLEDRPEYKNKVKQLLYKGLSEITGKSLPWGTLTGIRPTKLALARLEEGQSNEEVEAFFEGQYLCSEEKTKLSIEIASRELDILRKIDYKNGYSVYIGIPFCPTRCSYCSFTAYSLTAFANQVDSYLDALCKEIEYSATAITDRKLTTVYIGGGTPTTLNELQLERLLKKVKEAFDFTYVEEFTVEAGRPDSITEEKLRILKEYGVTRISINPQTMKQETLDIIGRHHTVEQIKESMEMARRMGHDNINMDLIIGLPNEDVEDVKATLEEIRAMNPESLTVHTLAIKRAAYLNMYKDKYADVKWGDARSMLQQTTDFAAEEGYDPYYLYRQKNMSDNLENVGYAKKGKECIYNIVIMEELQDIIACGAGASTKFINLPNHRIERVENVKNVTEYIARIDEMIERKRRFIEDEYYNSSNIN